MKVLMKKCGFSFFLSLLFLLFTCRYVVVNDLFDKLDIHSGVVAVSTLISCWLFFDSIIGLVSFVRDRRAAKRVAAPTDPED